MFRAVVFRYESPLNATENSSSDEEAVDGDWVDVNRTRSPMKRRSRIIPEGVPAVPMPVFQTEPSSIRTKALEILDSVRRRASRDQTSFLFSNVISFPPADGAGDSSERARLRRDIKVGEGQLALQMDVARHMVWEISEAVASHERQRLRAIEESAWKKKELWQVTNRLAAASGDDESSSGMGTTM